MMTISVPTENSLPLDLPLSSGSASTVLFVCVCVLHPDWLTCDAVRVPRRQREATIVVVTVAAVVYCDWCHPPLSSCERQHARRQFMSDVKTLITEGNRSKKGKKEKQRHRRARPRR